MQPSRNIWPSRRRRRRRSRSSCSTTFRTSGLETVAAYLIPSKAGLILIDTTYADTADQVLDNVRKLGHDPAQIKHIVITHGHPDHAGGAARIKQVTGARVMMARADWEQVERAQGGRGATTLAREDVINDGDKLTLGEVELWFYLIGGHAPGNLATEIHGVAGGREFRTLLAVDFAPAAGTTKASLASVERLKELGPWDALLPGHPFLAPVAVPTAGPATARQILAGERVPPYPTKQAVAVGAQRVNAYLDEIRAALQKRLASEQRR